MSVRVKIFPDSPIRGHNLNSTGLKILRHFQVERHVPKIGTFRLAQPQTSLLDYHVLAIG